MGIAARHFQNILRTDQSDFMDTSVGSIERAGSSRLAMWASWPTARPAHATAHLINSNLDAAFSGGFLLSRGDPTNPLVTRERGDVGPKVRGYGIKLDGPLEIWRQLVNCAVREFLGGHTSKRECFA